MREPPRPDVDDLDRGSETITHALIRASDKRRYVEFTAKGKCRCIVRADWIIRAKRFDHGRVAHDRPPERLQIGRNGLCDAGTNPVILYPLTDINKRNDGQFDTRGGIVSRREAFRNGLRIGECGRGQGRYA